ncbi:MAG: hypothetical protein JSS65_01030 [Armatimonadetes bacterium]|nr:hypothetical protein [Armatimonadota bacterium]
MKLTTLTIAVITVASGLLAGCAGEDKGTPPPAEKPLTQEQLNEMPPAARQNAENAAKAGDAQAKRMQEMADARKKAEGK